MRVNHNLWYCLALPVLLAITIFAYTPGLVGIFLVDDVYNLNTLNARGGVVDWPSFLSFVFENKSGMLGRPISMASFLLDDQYYPGSVEKYRYTNLMIHCLCGVVIFVFVRQLCLIAFTPKNTHFAHQVSLVAVAWWLLSPMNVSTTLYIIQRMTQLATLFCLAGLFCFVYGKYKILSGNVMAGRIYAAIGLFGFGGLAALSKENGVLIFCLAPIIELTIAHSRGERPDKFLLGLAGVPLLVGALFVLWKWDSLTRSSVRDFTAWERLLTESRILWDYLAKLLLPFSGKMGLVHDDIVISRGLFSPITTIVAIIGHAALVFAALFFRKASPWLFLGVFGFYAGHLLESTVIPLELYFEHRNYLPAVFVYIGVVGACWHLPVYRSGVKIACCVSVALALALCVQRAAIWGNPKAQITIWAQEHPDSVRAQTMYARSLIAEKRYQEAEKELYRLQKKWPEYVHNDLVILNQSCAENMTLNFSNEMLLQKVAAGTYDGSLPAIFEETFRLYKTNRCDLIDEPLMRGLFDNVLKMKRVAHTFKAKVYFWEMEFHARNGYLDGAIEALDNTFKYQKDGYVLYLKAGLLFSAGIFEPALIEVDKAIAMEMQKAPVFRYHLENYQALRTNLRKAIEQASSN